MDKTNVEALHITKVAVNDALLSGSMKLDEAKAHITEVAIAANLKVDSNTSSDDTDAPVVDEDVVTDDTVVDDVTTDEEVIEEPAAVAEEDVVAADTVVDEEGIELADTAE